MLNKSLKNCLVMFIAIVLCLIMVSGCGSSRVSSSVVSVKKYDWWVDAL